MFVGFLDNRISTFYETIANIIDWEVLIKLVLIISLIIKLIIGFDIFLLKNIILLHFPIDPFSFLFWQLIDLFIINN